MERIFPWALVLGMSGLATTAGASAAEVPYSFVLDRYHSSRMGSELLLSLHRMAWTLEDAVLKPSWGRENDVPGKALGITYRLAKSVFLDHLMDTYVLQAQHEYFGHGARLREYGYKESQFRFNWPFPWGDGSAVTSRGPPPPGRTVTPHEHLTMFGGGVESTAVMADSLRRTWLIRGAVHYRETLLYLLTFNDAAFYIWQTDPGIEHPESSANDILRYLSMLQEQQAASGGQSLGPSLDQLSSQAFINLLNPFQYYALYTYLFTYLWSGGSEFGFPMIRIGTIRYLPAFRFGLTPFGSEYISEHLFVLDRAVLQGSLRFNHPACARPFWGLGFKAFDLSLSSRWTLDAAADIWHQPELVVGGSSLCKRSAGLGGALQATVRHRMKGPTGAPLQVLLNIGYKTSGYVESERLDRGLILRVGLRFQ